MDIPLPEDFQIHHRNLVPPTNQNTKKKEAEEEKAETFSATVGESLATRIDLTKEWLKNWHDPSHPDGVIQGMLGKIIINDYMMFDELWLQTSLPPKLGAFWDFKNLPLLRNCDVDTFIAGFVNFLRERNYEIGLLS